MTTEEPAKCARFRHARNCPSLLSHFFNATHWEPRAHTSPSARTTRPSAKRPEVERARAALPFKPPPASLGRPPDSIHPKARSALGPLRARAPYRSLWGAQVCIIIIIDMLAQSAKGPPLIEWLAGWLAGSPRPGRIKFSSRAQEARRHEAAELCSERANCWPLSAALLSALVPASPMIIRKRLRASKRASERAAQRWPIWCAPGGTRQVGARAPNAIFHICRPEQMMNHISAQIARRRRRGCAALPDCKCPMEARQLFWRPLLGPERATPGGGRKQGASREFFPLF